MPGLTAPQTLAQDGVLCQVEQLMSVTVRQHVPKTAMSSCTESQEDIKPLTSHKGDSNFLLGNMHLENRSLTNVYY